MANKQKIFETSEGISLNLVVGEDNTIDLTSTNPEKIIKALNQDLQSPDLSDRAFAQNNLELISALGGIHKETSC